MTDEQLCERLILILRALLGLMTYRQADLATCSLPEEVIAKIQELKRLPEIAVGSDEVDDERRRNRTTVTGYDH